MRRASRVAAAFAATAVLATSVHAAVQKVTRQGRYLYNADGSRFFIKGIAYQEQGAISEDPNNPFLEPSTFIDTLADGDGCARDLPFLQQLGINTIRAYSVNSSLNHDACMNALSNAGIYAIVDLALPITGSINRAQPAWSTDLLDTYIGTIDAFSKYDNVLAFNVGNEVVTNASETATTAFVKAAARDTKAYLTSKGSSALVGYAAIDADDSWLDPFANYLSCDPSGQNSGATAIDLFGLNNYEWCGDAQPSVYNDKNGAFAGYNVAAYFSEFGCITSPPRLWTEVGTIFSEPMSDIWSGGLAFSYFPATSSQGQFGMVTVDGSTVTPNDDFGRLKTQYGQVTLPTGPPSTGQTTTYPTCPTANSTFLASTTLPPTPNDNSCNCLEASLACQFTPHSSNATVVLGIVGSLIDEACGLLGQQGGSCDAIAADGAAGKYGPVSPCNAEIKLSYVMDQYYEATNRAATSCDFGGNATVNSKAPSNSAGVASAASSCLSNPSATFVPSAPATTSGTSPGNGGGGSNGNGGGSGGGDNTNSAMAALRVSQQAVLGAVFAGVFSLIGGLFVLA